MQRISQKISKPMNSQLCVISCLSTVTFAYTLQHTMSNAPKQILETAEVKIIDGKKKSSFRVRRLINFPVVENLKEFREAILEAMPDLPCNSEAQFAIGYILDRNKKYSVTTERELADCYAAVLNGYSFWVDPHDFPQQVASAQESKLFAC